MNEIKCSRRHRLKDRSVAKKYRLRRSPAAIRQLVDACKLDALWTKGTSKIPQQMSASACTFESAGKVGCLEYLALILAILFVDLLALVSPGPNFVLVSSAAVAQSRRHAVWTACGIATGSFAWAGAAALGIVSIFEVFPVLGLILKVVGATYLIYLGIKLLRSKGFQPADGHNPKAKSEVTGYWRGFLVNMTNPKSAAYYASVFATFLTQEMPTWVLVVLVSSIALMSLAWHVVLAIGFSAAPIKARYISVSKYVDRLCGSFLVLLGLRLAWDSR